MHRKERARQELVVITGHRKQVVYITIPEDFPSGSRFYEGQKDTTGIRVVLPPGWNAKLGYAPKSKSLSYDNVLEAWQKFNAG